MATLEKIRNKSVFLIVIIGLALLAFILTDFLTSGRTLFGDNTSIAKVDGEKINIIEFQQKYQEAQQAYQQQGRQIDPDDLQAQVLQQMVSEALMKKEMERLGLTVTDKELNDFFYGAASQMLDQRVQQETGIGSVRELYDYKDNPSKYGLDAATVQQLVAYASKLEKEVADQLMQMKFYNLFAGTLVANQLDAQAYYNDNARTAHILYARQDYSAVPDSTVTITDNEVKAEWERTKNNYRLSEESRTISYITVDIVPSPADIQAAQKKVEDGIIALRDNPGTSGLDNDAEFLTTTVKSPAASIKDSRLKSFLDSAAVGTTALVSTIGNDYTFAKVVGKTSDVDSILVDVLVVQGKTQMDSLLNGLNAGTIALKDALKDASVVNSQDSLWVNLYADATTRQIFADAPTGVFYTPDSTATDGGRVMRVRSQKAPVTVYEYITAEYTASPSNATVNSLYADISAFAAENKTAQEFVDNAPGKGYQIMEAVITPSSAHIGNLPDTRNAVRWTMKEGKKGQVSPVMGSEQTGRYMVVAINNVYDGEFVPYTEPRVRTMIEDKLRRDKKAETLIAKYEGNASDVPGYAALMGVSVDTTTVTYGQPMIPRIGGGESRLIGRVAATPVGKVVSPMQANSGVVTFVVTSIESIGRPYDFAENAAAYERSFGGNTMARNIDAILLGRNKVDNRSLKFYGGAE